MDKDNRSCLNFFRKLSIVRGKYTYDKSLFNYFLPFTKDVWEIYKKKIHF